MTLDDTSDTTKFIRFEIRWKRTEKAQQKTNLRLNVKCRVDGNYLLVMLSDTADCQNHLLMDQKYLFSLCRLFTFILSSLFSFRFHYAPLLLCLFISLLFSSLFAHLHTNTLCTFTCILLSIVVRFLIQHKLAHKHRYTGIDLKWFWHRNR